MKIAIVDYGRGNLHSVQSGLEKALELSGLTGQVFLSADASMILSADKVVFPGVGAMGDCYQQLMTSGLEPVVRQAFATKPFLGICVGMQVLFESGEENGGSAGMGLIPGRVVRFEQKAGLKVPHMGWNQVMHQSHPLFKGIPSGARFYFVHSYQVQPKSVADVQIATCDYGGEFPVAIAGPNWLATQFHPEKSHQWGLQLLSNFIQWQPPI